MRALPLAQTVIPSEIFRAYDIRGIVDKTLQLPHVALLGYALGLRAKKSTIDTIIVGRDGRLSSPAMFQALTQGIVAAGCQVRDIGLVTSPMLYFAIQHWQIPHGIMITGSHNPKEYNGLKITLNNESLYGEALQDLARETEHLGKVPIAPISITANQKQPIVTHPILSDYLDVVVKNIRLKQPLTVVIDCGNGASGVVAQTLFERLGCKVIPLYCEVDGNFPNHHPDPGQPKNLEKLQATIKQEQADIGLAFDGDGDRVGLVDNQGTIIWPDRFLMLLAQDLLQRHPGSTVIFDVKCSQHVAPFIQKYGGTPLMSKTGHSLIKAQMKKTGALLAGELSGHVFIKERWYGFDDGLYTGARILEIVSEALYNKTYPESSALFQTLPISLSTPELQIPVTEQEKFQIIQQFVDAQATFGGTVTTIDGMRIDFEDGFGLIRASNTSPNLILRFEGENEDSLARIQALFRKELMRINADLNF